MLNEIPGHREIAEFTLGADEIVQAADLVTKLVAQHPAGQEPDFLHAAALASHQLPERLRSFLLEIRARESAAAAVVSGFPVDDVAIGPTPSHWSSQADQASTRIEEAWLVLCGSLLGDLFGWATQQAGMVVHNIAPSWGDEHRQVGSSSSELLWWHTEEAFHPLRCDYLGLLCLRNQNRVPTTIASVGDVVLDAELRQVLFEKRFVIRPDDSHLGDSRDEEPVAAEVGAGSAEAAGAGRTAGASSLEAARRRVQDMDRNPRMASLLSGGFDRPYLTIDPFYMSVPSGDPQARQAYDVLRQQIDSHIESVVLGPGEILFVDNYRAVHGRRPFRARYDGTDRWLKRVSITRDLRKSRAFRATCDSRVVY
jgi:Fe(II)/alpha-ketoglutarate-dependent arginine beta-hydroxylase